MGNLSSVCVLLLVWLDFFFLCLFVLIIHFSFVSGFAFGRLYPPKFNKNEFERQGVPVVKSWSRALGFYRLLSSYKVVVVVVIMFLYRLWEVGRGKGQKILTFKEK